MLSKLFDEYSLNARVKPSLLALFPIIVAVYVTTPELYNLFSSLFGILVACGLITVLAHFSRYRGRIVEKILFSKWGGKPTTIILRNKDQTLDKNTKLRYHQFFCDEINNWVSPTLEDENLDLSECDAMYETAIKWLLEKTRNVKTYNLIYKENISYGFRRNCYGIKYYGIIISIIAIVFVICSQSYIEYENLEFNLLELSSVILSFLTTLWWILLVSESWVRDAANCYALRLLASCDQINN